MQLFPHQQKALDLTAGKNRVAYYLDMGLGKTFVGGEKANSYPERIVLVCQKSKIDDWISHFKEHYPLTVFDLTNKKQLEEFTGIIGKCVGVINYDLVFRRSYFAHISGFTLMLDESSIIQNEAAKRSKFILKMQPENVILLSGTPTAGKYEKLWSQLRLLGWTISKDLFYKQYVETEWIEDHNSGFRIPHVVGYKNVDRLKKKLAEHGAIFMKSEEVFDLPEQVMIPVHSKPTKEYRKFMRDAVITIEGREFIGDTTLSHRTYSRMMCSYLNKERVAAFKDLVQSTEDRLIVFYNFNDELNTMQAALAELERPFSVVNGEIKDLTAYEEYGDSITFVQYQAGAMGLNLQKANRIIYFALTDRSELFEQSKKRIHRIGQEKTCFYYLMLCPGTVEEDILHTLELRKDYTDELFKKYQEGFDWQACSDFVGSGCNYLFPCRVRHWGNLFKRWQQPRTNRTGNPKGNSNFRKA